MEATELAYTHRPEHLCSSCKTLLFPASLYKLSAKILGRMSAALKGAMIHDDGGEIINKFCSMCRDSLKKDETPKFSILHGPCFPEVHDFIKELNPLEARLVAPKLAFGSIYQLPRGGQFGLKGGMISVVADMSKIQTHLPRTFDECATLNCDLKRRLVFNNAYIRSLIRPKLVMQSLNWLKDQPLYKAIGVTVRKDWDFMSDQREKDVLHEDAQMNDSIARGIAELQKKIGNSDDMVFEAGETLSEDEGRSETVRAEGLFRSNEIISNQDSKNATDHHVENVNSGDACSDGSSDEDINPQSLYDNLDTFVGEDETFDQSMDPRYDLGAEVNPANAVRMTTEELRSCTLNIAPGEGMSPKGLNVIAFTEELTHPQIFGGQPRREEDQNHLHKIRVRKEMMNEDRRAARDIYYNFFQMRKLQQPQIQSMAYISMRKGAWGNANFTAGLLKTDAGREQIIQDNHGFNELANLRGSPHALTKLKKNVYAMMRQKGPPTLFLTFSAADSHWFDILAVLYRTQHKKEILSEDAAKLPWAIKCALIRGDPISVARYYEHRMRHFFDNMVLP